jgi:transmembrane sensor
MSLNTQIYEQASNWFVSFRAGDVDASGRKEFDAWIRKSPEHLRAYLEITEIWQDATQVGEGRDARLSSGALVADAKSDDIENVIPLDASRLGGGTPVEVPGRRFWVTGTFALAALILIALAGGSLWYYTSVFGVYGTDIGEQRTVRLDDGSTVELNALSKVRVRFTEGRRDVALMQGQALFHVAHDETRPFVVRTEDTAVRAVGTQFDVYRKETGTTVTVVEGHVAVVSSPVAGEESGSPAAPAPEHEILLAADEQVTIAPKIQPRVERVRATTATAWTQHQLVFKATPLSEVATEFNRYNTRRLVIHGTGLTDFHVSGVYSSTDPALLIRFLRVQPGLRIEETDDEIRISADP